MFDEEAGKGVEKVKGNCFAYTLAQVTGEPEEDFVDSYNFFDRITELGFEKCDREKAEIVVKIGPEIPGTTEKHRIYHAAVVHGRDRDGNLVIRQRWKYGVEAETLPLEATTPTTPGAVFGYYGRLGKNGG